MKLFNRGPKPASIRVIHSTSMRAATWRSAPELVIYAQRLFQSPEFQTLIGVLRNESPSNFGLAIGATHDDQIAHSYKAAGYQLCLNTLEALTTQTEKYEPLDATFEPEKTRIIT